MIILIKSQNKTKQLLYVYFSLLYIFNHYLNYLFHILFNIKYFLLNTFFVLHKIEFCIALFIHKLKKENISHHYY